MLGKIVLGLAVLATTSFAMSLSELNKASKDELMQINGVGEIKAASIIKERKKGKFKTFDGLSSRVEGIGAQIASNIKNDVKVGETPKKVSKKTASKKKTKADKKVSDTKSKSTAKKETASKKADDKKKKVSKTKSRKIKSVDEKKKELKTKSKKTKTKKTKSKKSKSKTKKKTKSKK